MTRLFVDIEVSQNVVLTWRTGAKIFISPDNIVKERAVICVCWKEQGGKTESATWDRSQNDKALIKRIIPVIAGADEIIGHNAERFDLPWLRARAMYHGLHLPIVRVVDTLKWARKYFYFNSNRLDFLGKFFGVGGKLDKFTHDHGSWRRVLLDNDRKELAAMVKYCARDIDLLEQVWERLSTICAPAVHSGVVDGREAWSCPRCSSEKIIQSKRRVTAKGTIQFQMQCKACSGFYSISARLRQKWLKERNAQQC